MAMNEIMNNMPNADSLYGQITTLIEWSRQTVRTAVNSTMVYTYYIIGRYIVENEQSGEKRASYGKMVLKDLSARLTANYGHGWSYANLKIIKQFYLAYCNRINNLNINVLEKDKQCLSFSNPEETLVISNLVAGNMELSPNPFTLSWSHYLVLMRIQNSDERDFYEIECNRQNWSVRTLQRQYSSSLYERLALSRNKDEVIRLAKEGQIIEKPSDIIKDPLTLEFLGLKPDASYSETKLENAIIDKMQQFLLELGKGFLFEARQKRFTFDEQHFFVDLVFYNRLLQCYVLVDLKTGRLSHQDIGQMQMYVNYYDRYVKQPFEKPTIGILLCKSKNDAMVNLTLPEDANIYASAYELYLPDKALLQSKVKEWIKEFEETKAKH